MSNGFFDTFQDSIDECLENVTPKTSIFAAYRNLDVTIPDPAPLELVDRLNEQFGTSWKTLFPERSSEAVQFMNLLKEKRDKEIVENAVNHAALIREVEDTLNKRLHYSDNEVEE